MKPLNTVCLNSVTAPASPGLPIARLARHRAARPVGRSTGATAGGHVPYRASIRGRGATAAWTRDRGAAASDIMGRNVTATEFVRRAAEGPNCTVVDTRPRPRKMFVVPGGM